MASATLTRRSVQAGVYPNVMVAAKNIVAAAGARGLFTGYLPTLLEDIPDMAFKFAAYESLRAAHLRLMRGRNASVQVRRPLICSQRSFTQGRQHSRVMAGCQSKAGRLAVGWRAVLCTQLVSSR